MKKVLLHICCGVCALYAIEKLKKDGYLLEGLFFNPNIYPAEEYQRRKKGAEDVGKIAKVKIIQTQYQPSLWFDVCGEQASEDEGGARCQLCYKLRLQKTFEVMKGEGFDFFATTLTISPHKDSLQISEIGKNIGADSFLAVDFKKNEGFKRTIELAKKYNLYRQNYCGCMYSKR